MVAGAAGGAIFGVGDVADALTGASKFGKVILNRRPVGAQKPLTAEEMLAAIEEIKEQMAVLFEYLSDPPSEMMNPRQAEQSEVR